MTSLDRRKDSHRGEVSLEERNLEALLDALGWALDEAAEEARQRGPVLGIDFSDPYLGQELLVQDVQLVVEGLRVKLAENPAEWDSPEAYLPLVFLTEKPGDSLHIGIWVRLTSEAKWIPNSTGGWEVCLPEELEKTLDSLDPEEREQRIARLVAPRLLSIDVEVCPGETRRQAVLHLGLAPFLWLPQANMAKLPIMVSLKTDGGWDTWPDQERPAVFEALNNACEQLLAAIHKTRQVVWGEKIEALEQRLKSLENLEKPEPSPVETKPFPLAFQETRLFLDPEVQEIRRAAHRLRGFPQHWKKVPRWADLERARVEDLVAGGVERAREAGLLAKRETVDPTTGAVRHYLTKKAERELELQAGTRKTGYRRRLEDGNEYLCRVFPTSKGHLELGFSFQGLAGPWVDSWQKDLEREAHQAQADLDKRHMNPFLFEELNEEQEERLVRFIEQARRLDRSKEILEVLLGQIWVQKKNPVQIPAIAFRELLGLHGEVHWKQHVQGALDFLRGCSFSHRVAGSGEKGRGNLLAHWVYIPAGPGDHAQGDYLCTITPAFLTAYRVWESGTVEQNGRTWTTYDPAKTLTPEERKALSYQRSHTGTPFFAVAEGLTGEQRNLLAWLEGAITLQVHPTRKGRPPKARRGSKEAHLPRVYRRDFCPLLPDGVGFFGALGRFQHNPESGRKLFGTSTRGNAKSGGHTSGLLEEMGHILPPGGARRQREAVVRQALRDMRTVVQDYLGGVVAAFDGTASKWLTLDAVEARTPDQLQGVRFLCFVPENYKERQSERWEALSRERVRQGKIPFAWTVTPDPQEAERSRLALQAGHQAKPQGDQTQAHQEDRDQGSEVWTPDMDPLWARLASAQRERGLSQKELGRLFGVDRSRVARWTKSPSPAEGMRGEPIPAHLVPLALRWVETGEAPTPEELTALDRRKAPSQGDQGGKCAEPR